MVIARMEAEACPISMVEQYMLVAKIPRDSKLFLFRHLKEGEWLKDGGVLSYGTLRDVFKAKVKQLQRDLAFIVFGLVVS